MKKTFKSYLKDRSGNFAIMFSIVASLLVGVVAIAFDTSRTYKLRESLVNIADSAALAGAYVATSNTEDREEVVKRLIEFHMMDFPPGIKLNPPSINFDDANSELTVSLDATLDTVLGSAFGFAALDVSGQSATTYAQDDIDSISMAFVLDVSGSMNNPSASGERKIDILMRSVSTMFDVIEETAPRTDILQRKMRTGMTAFDIDLVPEYTVPMNFGWIDVENEVNSLNAGGDTNTTPAFQLAHQMLLNDTPKAPDLREYIILMTDGANDDPDENGNTRVLCETAKAQGMQIFSIAFEIPEESLAEAQDLLRGCASGDNNVSGDVLMSASLSVADSAVTIPNYPDSEQTMQYYFEAENAAELQTAFQQIGEEIGKFETRIIR